MTDLFVNLADNLYLDMFVFSDVKGFPRNVKVTSGMETVEALYGGYEDGTLDKLDTFSQNRGTRDRKRTPLELLSCHPYRVYQSSHGK